VDVGYPILFRELSNLLAKVSPVYMGVGISSVLEVVVRGQSDANSICANGSSDGLDDLEGKATSVLDAASVCVCSDVDVIVQKLVNEVAIAAGTVSHSEFCTLKTRCLPMNLHTVKTSFHRPSCSRGKFFNSFLDFGNRHRLGWCARIFRAIQRFSPQRNVAGADSVMAVEERWDRGASDMPQLTIDESSLGMDSIGHPLPPCDLVRGEDAWDPRIAARLLSMSNVWSDPRFNDGETLYHATDWTCFGQQKALLDLCE